MPTENRSSNTEMVSVPREAVVQAAELLQEYNKCSIARGLRAILAQPAERHQAEPVALPARKKTTSGLLSDSNTHNRGWNACLDEIDKLGPIYTHAEVEPTPECFCVEHGLHIEDLKAQLAEAHTLLREIHDGRISGHERWLKIEAVLSASAEPSAPTDCAICRDLGNQCMECEEGEFRQWADRHFAAADYRKTDAGVFIQDWMRHSYGAWCARGALASKQ
ncbi:hypothetical protein KY382_24385 [Pseudomonas monteilii]|nr:hypothetical protein [Pseudomonas monteilii]